MWPFGGILREKLISAISKRNFNCPYFSNLWAYVAILDFVKKECLCLKIKSKIVKIASSQVYPLLTYFANFSQYSVQSLFILQQIGQAGPITPHAIPLWINQQKNYSNAVAFCLVFVFFSLVFCVLFFRFSYFYLFVHRGPGQVARMIISGCLLDLLLGLVGACSLKFHVQIFTNKSRNI